MDEFLRERLLRAMRQLAFLADLASTGPKAERVRLEAHQLEEELKLLAEQEHPARAEFRLSPTSKVLLEQGNSRLVAPLLRRGEGNRTFINGRLSVEHRETDAAGGTRWDRSAQLEWANPTVNLDLGSTRDLFVLLLAGARYDDRDLREHQRIPKR